MHRRHKGPTANVVPRLTHQVAQGDVGVGQTVQITVDADIVLVPLEPNRP